MSYSLTTGSVLAPMLGDGEVAALFSAEADVRAMLAFEAALAHACAEVGLVPADAATRIAAACDGLTPDFKRLGAATAEDGVVVAELVRQLRGAVDSTDREYVHFGATSQDAIDTSLVLRLREVNALLGARLDRVSAALEQLRVAYGEAPLMARTRMQAARPIRAGDRIEAWAGPIGHIAERLAAGGDDLHCLQFAGPTGTLAELAPHGAEVRRRAAARLGLADPGGCWHTDRRRILDYADGLSRLTGALGKLGQDLALMAQNEIAEVAFAATGGSSSMAHKRNPVRAETLVTLARANATHVAGMHQALVHEQERSGAAWTLEWLLLPQMCLSAGASLRNAETLLAAVRRLGGD